MRKSTQPNIQSSYDRLVYTLRTTSIQITYLPFVVSEKLSEVIIKFRNMKGNTLDKDSRKFQVPRNRVTDFTYTVNDIPHVFRYGVSNPCNSIIYGCTCFPNGLNLFPSLFSPNLLQHCRHMAFLSKMNYSS